ncbi:MAG TPA: thiolase family protein, partial [Verrucomicrobiae bacterium]|nr:thiolase family protein [Verrucomicrobiae bacterium]
RTDADRAKALQGFAAGADMLNPETWIGYYQSVAQDLGDRFELGAGRSPFIDTYALQAKWSMKHEGLTREHLAAAAAKAHNLGVLNPRAQYRFAMTAEDVLADRLVSDPLTRAMCAPIGDGVAAAILCDEATFAGLDASTRARAVRVKASILAGGDNRAPSEPGVLERAAAYAFKAAKISPADIDVTEVHDATSYGEIHIPEALGLCARGEAGPLALAGETSPLGRMPINPSGGLVCRGHPVGATGLAMIFELTSQLRGESGERQVADARLALAQNGGGVMGFDEAVTAITILEAA